MGMYNDDLLFIHIPKTGGWSCKTYLKQNCPGMLGPDDPDSRLPIGHVRLQDIERFTGRKPESFKQIIAVVRNPYEQQLSQWMFWRDRYARGQRHIHDIVAAASPTLTAFLQQPNCDFHCWYLQHHGFEPGMTPAEQQQVRDTEIPNLDGQNRYKDFGGMFLFWITVDGEIPGNVEILRCEDLSTAFPAAVSEFMDGSEMQRMARLNTSPGLSGEVREYYTPLAARLVEQKCQYAFRCHYDPWKFSDFA